MKWPEYNIELFFIVAGNYRWLGMRFTSRGISSGGCAQLACLINFPILCTGYFRTLPDAEFEFSSSRLFKRHTQ